MLLGWYGSFVTSCHDKITKVSSKYDIKWIIYKEMIIHQYINMHAMTSPYHPIYCYKLLSLSYNALDHMYWQYEYPDSVRWTESFIMSVALLAVWCKTTVNEGMHQYAENWPQLAVHTYIVFLISLISDNRSYTVMNKVAQGQNTRKSGKVNIKH